MVFSHKKGQQSMDQMAIIIAAIVGLVVILLIYTASTGSFLNFDFFSETACWGSNGVRCGGGAFTLIPNLCTTEKIDEPIKTEEDLAEMLRTTYYMYHQSTCDFNNIGGQVYTVYFFELEKEMEISSLMAYLFEHNRGKEELDITKTDISYLEENTEGNTLCFDSRKIKDFKLEKETTYYIHYWDRDTLTSDKGDRIIITEDANIITARDELEDMFIPELTVKGVTSKIGEFFIYNSLTGGLYGVVYTPLKAGYNVFIAPETDDKYCLDYGLVIA